MIYTVESTQTKKMLNLIAAQPNSRHEVIKIPLPDLKTLQPEINRDEELLKCVLQRLLDIAKSKSKI
jgi:hypothetical protein